MTRFSFHKVPGVPDRGPGGCADCGGIDGHSQSCSTGALVDALHHVESFYWAGLPAEEKADVIRAELARSGWEIRRRLAAGGGGEGTR